LSKLTGLEREEKEHIPLPKRSVTAEVPQAHSKGAHVGRTSEVVVGAEINELLPPDLLVVAGCFEWHQQYEVGSKRRQALTCCGIQR
jgi:hypothetical protein